MASNSANDGIEERVSVGHAVTSAQTLVRLVGTPTLIRISKALVSSTAEAPTDRPGPPGVLLGPRRQRDELDLGVFRARSVCHPAWARRTRATSGDASRVAILAASRAGCIVVLATGEHPLWS